MKANVFKLVLILASAPILFVQPAQAVTFQLVTQLDTAALNAGVPGSVAAYGDDVYIGGLFGGGQLHHITDPLGSPLNSNTFGGGGSLPGNGYVSLSTDGTTLVAATNNAGGSDLLESYAFGTDTLNFSTNPAGVGASRFDGAAVDPNTGNIFVTGFGSGFPKVLDPSTGADNSDSPSSLFTGGTGTGFRDVEFNTNGDIFLKAVNGVARGNRTGADDFGKPVNAGAGVDAIVNIADGFNSAINVEFLPQNVVIFNVRNNADTFNDQVLVYDASAIDSPVAATFLATDGVTPFTTADAGSGIYDFSYDPVNALLYISDFSTSQVHVFEVIPEPSSLALSLGLLAIAAGRARGQSVFMLK